MPREKTPMRQVREVLRLKFDQKLAHRDIARSCGISATAVRSYFKRFEFSRLSWPLADEWTDEKLEEKLFPPLLGKTAEKRILPDFSYLHKELQRKGVTLLLLWGEYREAHPEGYGYSRFCDLYKTWVKSLEPVMRQSHKAGEKMFVDYAGMTMGIVDRKTGEVREAQIFVASLGASNYTYAEATWTQELPNWIASHIRAFEFFEGTSLLLIPDNLKSGVVLAHRYEPILNPTYQEMARHYHIGILPARSRKPRDKAKVESAVQVVERWILAPLRNCTFFSLSEINEAIWERLGELNQKPFQKLPGSRLQRYETLEKPALNPLPPIPYEFAEWKKVRVNIDYHVEIQKHYYSVPYQLLHQELEARITCAVAEIFHKGQRVASHVRSWAQGGYSTLREHMPKNHREYAQWTPERLCKWAAETGEATRAVVEKILSNHVHPQQGFRPCLGIMRLGKSYGVDRLEAACRRVLKLSDPKYRHIESILKSGLDQKPLEEAQPVLPALEHEFVRGAEYYQTQN
jgi:transposase